jgi:hypothetical protein
VEIMEKNEEGTWDKRSDYKLKKFTLNNGLQNCPSYYLFSKGRNWFFCPKTKGAQCTHLHKKGWVCCNIPHNFRIVNYVYI